MSGKGSKQRPRQVSRKELELRWAATFETERKAFWDDVRIIAQEAKSWPDWKKGAVDRPANGTAKTRR